jgi:diguanylate cyclase (GGDEF)-like protein
MRFFRLPEGWTRRKAYALLGALLAVASPLGLLALRSLLARETPTVEWVLSEVRADPSLFAYLSLGSLALFVALGRTLGKRVDTLAEASITDPLTRLYNRRHLNARLGEELARAERNGAPVAVLLLDVDHLKGINDSFGHEGGDGALRAVAETLRRACRRTDLPARYGGDELAVLLPQTTAEQGIQVAERIRTCLRVISAGLPFPVTVSIGVADVTLAGAPSAEALLDAADGALYAAKRAGRDQAVLAAGA